MANMRQECETVDFERSLRSFYPINAKKSCRHPLFYYRKGKCNLLVRFFVCLARFWRVFGALKIYNSNDGQLNPFSRHLTGLDRFVQKIGGEISQKHDPQDNR